MANEILGLYQGELKESVWSVDEYELFIDSDELNKILQPWIGMKVRVTIEQIE